MPTESGAGARTIPACEGEDASAAGAAVIGEVSDWAAFELLQPGLERSSISASACRPAAIPRILIIFMGKFVFFGWLSGCRKPPPRLYQTRAAFISATALSKQFPRSS